MGLPRPWLGWPHSPWVEQRGFGGFRGSRGFFLLLLFRSVLFGGEAATALRLGAVQRRRWVVPPMVSLIRGTCEIGPIRVPVVRSPLFRGVNSDSATDERWERR